MIAILLALGACKKPATPEVAAPEVPTWVEVEPGADSLSELRLVLQAGGQPVSETWLDRWTW